MKTLKQHINEKLIVNQRFDEKLVVNKDYKYSDILDKIKDSKWKEIQYAGKQTEDITVFDKFVTYVRENTSKEISYATASRRVNKDKYICGINIDKKIMVLYHKSDVEHDLFERIAISLGFSSSSETIMFTYNLKMLKSTIAPLNTRSTFYKEGTPEHYEISKETFDKFVNLYKEL